jgi:hypothetical protein
MSPARTKVIMVIACGVGIAAGTLTYLTSRSIPQALLTAGRRDWQLRRPAPPVHQRRT